MRCLSADKVVVMRVLIVDDESLARTKLRRMLGVYDDFEVVGEAEGGAEALALVTELDPDAVFLDVQMPEVGGFDVAAQLPEAGPALVFVTAFDDYALRAFDAAATDYLLKPVSTERLERTVHRLRARARTVAEPAVVAAPRLLILDRGETHVVLHAEIEWLQSADNYVHVHWRGRSLLLRATLATLLADLGDGFARVHRGTAVALRCVALVRPRSKGDATVVLDDGTELPCSRQHRAALLRHLQGSMTAS